MRAVRVLWPIIQEVGILNVRPVGELIVAQNYCLTWAGVDILDGKVRLKPVLEARGVLFERRVRLVMLDGPHDELGLKIAHICTQCRNTCEASNGQ